jgi:uncharacterized protein YegL
MIGNLLSRYEGTSMKIDMVDYEVAGQQIDTFCNVAIRQKFMNNTGKLLNCSYVFPNDNKFCIYDTEFVLDDQIIRPELRRKEEAKKEYEEAVEQGHTAMFGQDLGDGTCEFKLGNLEDKKEVEIRIKASFLCTCTKEGVSLKFPLAAKFQRGQVTTSIPDNVNFQFKMNVHQNSSDIKDIKCSVKCETKKIDDKTFDVLINETPNSDAILIETELAEGGKSQAIASDGYICISVFPSFEVEVESNSEFVFLVDCSGSMSGSRINNAAKCMKIFIRSLPENCKFSIWRFGSRSECMIPTCDYVKEKIDEATSLIDNLQANLGGTNLLEPIDRIMRISPPNGFTRQVFVLTDGEISNTKDVLGKVRAMRGSNRIFSIGLGRDADSGLIDGLAEIANGSGIRVNDNDEKLTEKVIGMLENAIQPAISNTSIISEGMTEQWPSPAPAIYNHSQQNFIIKSPYQEYVLISGSVAGENVDETVYVNKATDGIGLKELFMSKAIEDLQYDIRMNHDESKKDKIIEYSLTSRVLSEYTAYVGIDFKSPKNEERIFSYAKRSKIIKGAARGPMCRCAAPMRMMCVDAAPMRMMSVNAAPMKMMSVDADLIDFEDDDVSIEKTLREKSSVEKHEISVEKLVNMQNPDGSWDSSTKINNELVNKYNMKVAATIASLAFIRKNAGSALNALKLIIKKALNFLNKVDSAVDWEAIISEEILKL